MIEYKEFVGIVAEIIVYVKKLTESEYREWRQKAFALAGQFSGEFAIKLLEFIDVYRGQEVPA